MNNNRPIILSPAGNLEKLKTAVAYGADAVYFGGEKFNLRDKAGNFTMEEIQEAMDFCQSKGVSTTFLLNAFLHESDIPDAEEYVSQIKHFPFDGIMVSDPGMLAILKEQGAQSPVHISTQMSSLNHKTIKLWEQLGVKRVVLARETSLEEIREIRKHTDVELEVFVHGALCISYSGRCLLSRFLSGRDANQGACSHPCRWKFSLIEEQRPGNHMDMIEHASGTEILSSKDLCLLKRIPEYVEAGVNAFKLEGRMKSLYYAANITRIYKDALTTVLEEKDFAEKLPFWEKELDMISHRPYTDDLFNEFDNMGFKNIPYINRAIFLGYHHSAGDSPETAHIKAFNPIRIGDSVEAIYPIENGQIRDEKYTVLEIYKDEKPDTIARPADISLIKFDKPMMANAILRKIKE